MNIACGIICTYHITAVGLGTYYPWIWGHTCIYKIPCVMTVLENILVPQIVKKFPTFEGSQTIIIIQIPPLVYPEPNE
jgi:hypothetical protein